MAYTYLLMDESGVSNCERQQILLPLGGRFLHEYGVYEVVGWFDKNHKESQKHKNVRDVLCNRLRDSDELKEMWG